MEASTTPTDAAACVEHVTALLGRRNVVLIGMMGAGKTSVGRRLANVLHLPFVDADAEIERAANLSIPEIFAHYGEQHFREGERRVIARVLSTGPKVVATGGGAFMAEETRDLCRASGITVWLKAELPVLMERVRKKGNRPLLNQPDPEGTMRHLLAAREPVYALADLTVASRDVPQGSVVADVIRALKQHLTKDGQA